MGPMLLSAARSLLVVVDVQERLLPVIQDGEAVVRNVRTLVRAARELSVPVLASEQYPGGLGPTVPAVADELPVGSVVEKITFACGGEPAFAERLAACGRDQIVLTGTEAHVCVLQTALRLVAEGHRVFLAADAVSSRAAANARFAIERMRGNGVEIVTTEMVLFEWMERAGTPVFRSLLGLIR